MAKGYMSEIREMVISFEDSTILSPLILRILLMRIRLGGACIVL